MTMDHAKIITINLHAPNLPHQSLYILSTWRNLLLDKSNFLPILYLYFPSRKCLEENTTVLFDVLMTHQGSHKHPMILVYLLGPVIVPLPSNNFVHFVSPATFSLYCHIFIFIYYVSYSSTNTEAIRIKLPDPNHTFTHLSASVHLSYLVLWACYYRCTIHILI